LFSIRLITKRYRVEIEPVRGVSRQVRFQMIDSDQLLAYERGFITGMPRIAGTEAFVADLE